MATKAALRLLVLRELKVIGTVATAASPAQMRVCDEYIDGARAALLEGGLCWWDEDDIPEAVKVPLSKFVAAQACAAFGKDGKGHEAKEIPARKRIAALKSSEERETVRQDYF